MRFNVSFGAVSYSALGLALIFGASAAHAQTMITTQPAPAVVTTPGAMVLQPAETTRTTRTVRTVHTFVPVRRQIVTTRTVTSRILPAEPAVAAETVAAAPQPLYNAAPAVVPAADFYPAPAYDYSYRAPSYDYGYRAPAYDYAYRAPAYDYAQPLYDVAPAPVAPAATIAPGPVVTAPAVAAPMFAAPLATQPVIYRYVYEWDRILVIDPATGIAVQAIPR
jgi:hypothetical protein